VEEKVERNKTFKKAGVSGRATNETARWGTLAKDHHFQEEVQLTTLN
jgi:hypothetical protein